MPTATALIPSSTSACTEQLPGWWLLPSLQTFGPLLAPIIRAFLSTQGIPLPQDKPSVTLLSPLLWWPWSRSSSLPHTRPLHHSFLSA